MTGVSACEEGFDLTRAFADVKMNDPKLGPIIQVLRGLESAISTHKDLAEAKEAFEAAGSIDLSDKEKSETELVRLEALFTHALMLYCRAVHSSSKARVKLDVLGSYSEEQKLSHKSVVALRDQVVAHFGKGIDIAGGPWNEDHVVLWRGRGRYTYSYPSRRAAHKSRVANALCELIDAATDRIVAYAIDRQNRLMTLLNPLLATDSEVQRRIAVHRFDEHEFFGKAMPLGGRSGLRLRRNKGELRCRIADGPHLGMTSRLLSVRQGSPADTLAGRQLSHRWRSELPFRNQPPTTKPSLQFPAQRLWVIWARKLPNFSKLESGRDDFCRRQTAELRHSSRMTACADLSRNCLEARAGIEPACADLQSAASPLRHRAADQRGEMGR
jgi:hypothetical protein